MCQTLCSVTVDPVFPFRFSLPAFFLVSSVTLRQVSGALLACRVATQKDGQKLDGDEEKMVNGKAEISSNKWPSTRGMLTTCWCSTSSCRKNISSITFCPS